MDEQARAQRRSTIVVIVLAALVGTLLVAGVGDDAHPASVAGTAASPAATTTTAVAGPTSSTLGPVATGAPASTAAPAPDDPGALPQTDERPVASDATFTGHVQDLWEAIRQDDPALGYPSFFPESAYLQVKAISDPAGDYQQRLIANFDEDVHALHAQLGANADTATFVGIAVPDDQAVWVQPGEESNQLPYWRVYGTTMQYEVDGQAGSFPVTSLISWRGQWYVVHLGAIR